MSKHPNKSEEKRLQRASDYAEKRKRTRSQTLAVAATNPNNLRAERLRRGEAR